MKFLKIVVLCFLFVACSSPKAVYDYDQEVVFEEYSSYNIYPNFQSGLSPLDEKRLLSSLENELENKSFTTSSVPDLYVNVYSEEYQEQSRNSLGIGIGGGGGNFGIGVSDGIPFGGPETYLKLTFDLIDVRDDSLVWQAVVEGEFNPDSTPEERQAQLQKMVKKALEGYPPRN